MKHIIMLRHAKSSSEDDNIKDFDRPLATRGIGDIPVMANEIAKIIHPDIIIASPALRAKETATRVNEIFESKILFHEKLYEASIKDILQVISEIDDDINNIMVVGHNPGLHYFIEYLSGKKFNKIPTCGAAILKSEAISWSKISIRNTVFKDFIYPKMFG